MHNHAAAIIDRRVDQVSTADILAVLNPVWTTKPELGRKQCQRLSMAFKWAVAANHIATNPAGDALAGVLPRHAGNGGHFDSLPASEVPAALRTIDASAAFWSTKAAIKMLALTATRVRFLSRAHNKVPVRTARADPTHNRRRSDARPAPAEAGAEGRGCSPRRGWHHRTTSEGTSSRIWDAIDES